MSPATIATSTSLPQFDTDRLPADDRLDSARGALLGIVLGAGMWVAILSLAVSYLLK